MKKVYKKSLTSKLYLIFGLCWVWMSMSSCLFDYYTPSSDNGFSGTFTFCQGETPTPTTYSYNQCTLGGGLFGSSGTSINVQWYYNTTGSTTIATSTALGTPVSSTTPVGGVGSVPFTPLTSAVGTFYYFGYITWSDPSCATDYTTGTQAIIITPPPSTISGIDTTCIGNTTTLTPVGPPGTWGTSSPTVATVSGGVVTGLSAGTTIISYTVGVCSALETVTVLATPVDITPAAPISFCQGTTTTLTTSPAGGTWSTSAPGVATVSTSGVVTGVTGGDATLTYTLGTGCYKTKDVHVIPIPGPIGGSPIACPGFDFLLTNSATSGTWTSSDPTIATIDPVTGIVHGLVVGTTTISYSGCGMSTMTLSVNPLPAPIVGPGYVCEGGATIALADATPGGTWSSSAVAQATAVTAGSGFGIVTGVAAGVAIITYMSPLSCFAVSTITINPLPAPISGIVPICVGNSMTLTNSAGGGLWNSSVTGVATIDPFTGTVLAMAGGTTTISYTNGCGTGTSVVTINALPEPITGMDTVCIGAHTTLADVTIGGTWVSSNPAVATIVSGAGSGLLYGVDVGTTTISYIMPGGCYVTTEATSFLLPSTITGAGQICPGFTTILSNSIPGGTWSSLNPAAATVVAATGVVTGLSADTAGMIYTTPYGCTAHAVVTVNPVPLPILGTTTLCSADIDTLSDLSPGGVWSSLNPSVATIDATTGIVTTVNGGSVTIKYTLPTGCATTKTFVVNPMPVPAVTFNPAINTFFAVTGYATYQWYNSVQGLIPGATTDHTAGLVNGYYYVQVTDANGCKGNSPHINYNSSMGVAQNATVSDVKVYPNPSTEIVYIQCPVTVNVAICSIDGKKIMEQANAKSINISKLPNGLYLIKIYDELGNQLKVQKLTKE